MSESTGTITVTNGSASVTGSGTLFATNFVGANDILVVNGAMYVVKSVTSDTALTLTQPYAGETASGKSYDIVHLTGEDIVNLLARKVTELVEKYGLTVNSITDTPGAGKIPQAGSDGKIASGWLPTFAGAGSSASGTVGAVPAPQQTDQPLFLLSNGTWKRGAPVTFIGDTGLNLNDYIEAGQYGFVSTAAQGGQNFPDIYGGILEIIGNNAGQFYQRFLGYSGAIYIRRGSNSGVFASWRKLSMLPSPQAAEGAGQWTNLFSEPGQALLLPAGGTWAFALTAYTSDNTFTKSSSASLIGVEAGGTTIVTNGSPYNIYGFAWRIA